MAKHRQPRTALISVAAYYKLGYEICSDCKELKPPDDFYEGKTACKACVSHANTVRQSKGHQDIVRVPVPGWGYWVA